MNAIATSQPLLAEAAMPVIVTDAVLTARFHLGAAHLRNGGLNLGWLVRDCVQRHVTAISRELSCRPSDLRDMAGDRAFAVIESCRIAGAIGDFAEDDEVILDLAIAPEAVTGWRSLNTFRSLTGAEIRIELVSGFAKTGRGVETLSPALMPERLLPRREDPAASRANVLASHACAWRAAAEIERDAPTCEIPVCAPIHMNGLGLIDTGALFDCIEQSEHMALAPRRRQTPISQREMHFFGSIADGDTLAVSTQSYCRDGADGDEIIVKSVLRRGSDGTVIGVAQTARQPAAW